MEHVAARLLPSLLAVPLVATSPAHAGGLPPTALDAGPEGVLDHTGDHRFTAVPLATKTVLTKSETRGGRVLRASILDGRWVLHGDRIVASAARRPRRASAGGGPPWLAVAAALTGLVLAVRGTRRAQAASRRRRELR
jgi:hypothetical protein